jgi:catechol-2,3-dioxygenase
MPGKENLMGKITGLGHIGIYVRDLDRMERFYRDFMGLTVTKRNAAGTSVFFSANPDAVDHEIAIVAGRPADDEPKLIQQLSLAVESLDDVRQFYRRLKAGGYQIQRTVSHASAVGCYFYDPEGNCCEVFWVTGKSSWEVTAEPVDLDQPDEIILEQVERHWQRTRGVSMGERPAATVTA